MTDHAAADFAWIGQLTAPELEHVRALQVSPWRAAVVSARTIKRLAAARAEDAARIAKLEQLLCEAADDIAGWGSYAADYFQTKHDLAGCVQRYLAAASAESDGG